MIYKEQAALKGALMFGASVLAFAVTGAHAQTAASDGGMGEIVVTAQKRAQSVNDVGITISAFSGSDLVDKGISTAEDLSQITPGLVVNDAGAQGAPIYTIRGVGFSNFYVNSSSTVGLYVDEVAIPYTVASRGALFDIERVEVLKGPQGDLYGRNTTAGQINFITAKPTRDFKAGGSIEYGRFSSVDAEAFVSGPIANGVQVRLAGKAVQSSGWQRSLSRPDDKELGAQDQIAFRGKVNFDLGSVGTLLLEGHWLRDKSDNVAATTYDGTEVGMPTAQSLPTVGTPIYSTGKIRAADWTQEFRPKRDNKLKGTSAHLDLDLGPVAFTSITAYDNFRRNETNDWDGAALNDSASINNTKLDVFSQEVRLASNGSDDFTWIVGGYYSWDKIKETYNFFMGDSYFAQALGVNQLLTRYKQKTESIAGFAHAEYQLASTLRLIGGVRYTEERRSFTGCTYDRDGSLANATNNIIIPYLIVPAGLPEPDPILPGGCSVYDDLPDSATYGTFAEFDEKITTKKWMWKAGLNFEPTRDLLVYLTASSGFKSGGFNGANANTKSQQVPYKPEKLTAYELGAKATLRDIGMQINGSVFYYDYKNKQESGLAVTFVGNISGITNIPKSRIYGAEMDMNWQITDRLSLATGGAYLNSKITDWTAISAASLYPDVVYYDASGSTLPNAPKWSFNATPAYKFPVSGDMSVELAGDVIYRDSTSGGGLAYKATKDYWLTNARISLGRDDSQWKVSLWGKNVFSTYYWQYASVGGNGLYVRVNGMPATYGIRLDVKW
ncbi:MAG: TonB-dependent receptor [Sphingomonadales bacterium]|nr:MAG: TonB-dependent receptor [Sphingomonadales bacterium]TNF01898.1 MAG: TonB-dependent receptor [Sphingomonadales bacterium]